MPPAALRLLLPALLGACTGEKAPGTPTGDDTGAPAERPELLCPGDAACPDITGPLRAGAAVRRITPPCFESWTDLDGDATFSPATEPFLDCGCDRLCPGDAGYATPDAGEGDGVFAAAWLAGFQNARPATGVHDSLDVRVAVFEQGATRVALVTVDLVGWFHPEVEATRDLLAARGADVDLLIVSATHNHEGPDTMGLWGPTSTTSGYMRDYAAWVREETATAVLEAIAGLRDVGAMRVARADIRDLHPRQANNLLRDSRDPQVVDPSLSAAHITDTAGNTITTLVHFGSHPESMADENTLLTADYPGPLRTGIEDGVAWDSRSAAGLGGTTLFLTGNLGGMMTPLGVDVHDPDGTIWSEYSFERTNTLGTLLALHTLEALDAGTPVADPTLAAATHRFALPVDNWGFQAMFLSGILDRQITGWDPGQPISPENTPFVDTEQSYLRIGPVQILTIPGELLPELALGGYDGSLTGHPDNPLVRSDNPNPPDLSAAPAGPYLLDHFDTPHAWLLGLGQDELGYIVPPWNFELSPTLPWLDQAPGDHYEETNSLGAQTAPIVDARTRFLLGAIRDAGI